MYIKILLCRLLLILLWNKLCWSAHITINTLDGPILGYFLNISGRQTVLGSVDGINIFLGIPYAEPPVGHLRFAKPVPKSPWKPNVYNATEFSAACPQTLGFLREYSFGPDFNKTSENCLYLNIYAPTSSINPSQQYPVMVWIHGGAYRYGSGTEYDGRVFAQEGVVVVTINYRLGVLGFLSTDDDVAAGNYALLDQVLALKWVKNNINSFGGDPMRITIFGQSAGGGSVSLHMFSALSKGLFRAVIPQSGCALSPWAIYRPPHKISNYTRILVHKLGCPRNSSVAMIQCLREKSADELIHTYVGAPPMIAAFAPRVDGYFIKDLPEVLLEKGDFNKDVTVMTGYVSHELSTDLGNLHGVATRLTVRQVKQNFFDKSRRYLSNADDMNAALLCVYPPSSHEAVKNRESVIHMNSDYGYVAPHIKMSEELSSHGVRVWLYDFTYQSRNAIYPEWMGVPHAEELYYQFGSPFFNDVPCPDDKNLTCPVTWGHYHPWSQTDKLVSRNTMSVWASFAKHRFQSSDVTVNLLSLAWTQFRQGGALLNISDTVYVTRLDKTSGIRFWDSFDYLNVSQPVPNPCHTSIIG